LKKSAPFFDETARFMGTGMAINGLMSHANSGEQLMVQRDLVEPSRTDKRFVRRGAKGAFITEVDVAWSLAGALCHRAADDRPRLDGGSEAGPSAHVASFAPSITGGRAASV
jgi:hypothetical protein